MLVACIVPVHQADSHLLGMQWQGKIFIDAALPFGLRSAPKIFNGVADAVEWTARNMGINNVRHYLDDFIVWGPEASPECSLALQLLTDLCSYLGVPLAPEKVEGPTSCITFLGIEIDTVLGEVCMPKEKVEQLTELLKAWQSRQRCTKRELLSIAGKLQHAATVVQSILCSFVSH